MPSLVCTSATRPSIVIANFFIGTESFDDFVRGEPEVQKRVFDEWNIKGTGPLATNGIDAGVKVRPTEEELNEMDSWPTPHFRSGWDSYFKNKPDKPVMHYSVIAGYVTSVVLPRIYLHDVVGLVTTC